jgi:hypothetical protein
LLFCADLHYKWYWPSQYGGSFRRIGASSERVQQSTTFLALHRLWTHTLRSFTSC